MTVRLEGDGQRIHRRGGDEDVSLCCVAVTGAPTCPVVALLARERRGAATAVEDTDLPLRAVVVCLGERVDHLLRRPALAQQCKAVWPVARICVGLRGDRA